jgi:D-alanyl-D-alanine carboxypeptidase
MQNRAFGRFLSRAAGAVLASLAGAAQAVTVPILVADVDSGRVIFSQAPTDPWYPASITKLMTTYVALDLIRQGRVSMDSLITISPAAAAEPPSKMGFKPGTQLTLGNALKIIMVKSANDVAYAIGENLGGTIDGFSGLMNDTARRIGMQDSRWTNANGLPDPRQWTSARDMAILARALLRDFPDDHDLFSISAIQFGGAVIPNHNGLLGRYPGADGMKTGFICSGGFNVVATATRNGRRIVAIVMGQPTPRERDVKTADLFDYGFATQPSGPGLDALPASSVGAPPDMRPYVCGGKKPPAIEEGPGAVTASGTTAAQLVGGATANSPSLALAAFSSPAMRGRTLPPRAPLQPVAVWIGRDPGEGQRILAEQAAEAQAAAANARTARVEAAKAKREAALAKRQAAKEAAAQAQAAKAAAKPAAKVAAKPAAKPAHGALPRNATAYTSSETSGMPEAKPGKGLAKAKPAAAKPAAQKAAAKPAAKAAPKPAKKAAAAKADE